MLHVLGHIAIFQSVLLTYSVMMIENDALYEAVDFV